MSHQVRIIETEARAVGDPEESREIEFTISTFARDSHHTVVNQNNWDLRRYERNPVVGWHHALWGDLCAGPDPDTVIGSGRARVEAAGTDNAHLVSVWRAEPREINELAEKVFRKVLFGSIRATSVGFAEVGKGGWGEGEEAQGMPGETYYFQGQELFEWSICTMGSNPETVKRELRSQTEAALGYIKARVPELTTRDIMRMTVKDVLEVLEDKPERAAFTSTTAVEARRPLVEFVRESLDTREEQRTAFQRAVDTFGRAPR